MEFYIEDEKYNVFYEDSDDRKWKYHISSDLSAELRRFYGKYVKYVNNGFFMISACGHGNDEESYRKNTDSLADDVRSYGLGYIRILGGYTVSDNESEVTGELLFVPQPEKVSGEEFAGTALRIHEKYKEGKIIVSVPDYKTGEEILSGNDTLIRNFSSVIGDVDGKTEWLATRNPDSFTKAVLMDKNKENLLFRRVL